MKRAARHATGRERTPLFASRSERMTLALNSGLLYPDTAPRDTQYPIETLEEAVKKIKSMLTVTRFSPTAVCIKVEPEHREARQRLRRSSSQERSAPRRRSGSIPVQTAVDARLGVISTSTTNSTSPRYKPPRLLKKLVRASRLGRKTAGGVYEHPEEP